MGRVRKMFVHLLRHYPPSLIVGVVVVTVLGFVGGTEPGMWPWLIIASLSGLGLSLNVSVILLNDGFMPVRTSEIPVEYEGRYRPMDDRTRARYLGDWIPLGRPLASPGDVCLLGAIIGPFIRVAIRLSVGRS